jgi:hypothetical protein
MSADEKLDWLHDFISSLADTVNSNVAAANQEFKKISRCLMAVEAVVKNIAAAPPAGSPPLGD